MRRESRGDMRSDGKSEEAWPIAFTGHVCLDEITPFGGPTSVAPGSAVLCGAMVAARLGVRCAVLTRMNEADEHIVRPLREAGAAVTAVRAPCTTYAVVRHPSENPDERELYIRRDAGSFTPADLPAGFRAGTVHLAGISDREFTLDFAEAVRARCGVLSFDFQAAVRVVGPGGRIVFTANPAARQFAELIDCAKLDVVEARLLTGSDDMAVAAEIVRGWGPREVIVTDRSGMVAATEHGTFRAAFCNRSIVGRTGRGDTAISAYLCRRLTHPPREALAFAAALVSVKMERPGPFGGSLGEVEERMRETKVVDVKAA